MINPLIIFDCDGVLLDSEALASRYEFLALRNQGLLITLEEYTEIACGKEGHLIESILKKQFQFELPSYFWQQMDSLLQDAFENELSAIAGVLDMLSSLSQAMCIASNSSMKRLLKNLSIVGLLSYFDGRIFSADSVAQGKPSPELFLYAARQMNTPEHNCIVIEDSLVGIEAGLAAGMTTIAFTGGSHITPSMNQKLQTSGAQIIFNKMSELKQLINLLCIPK